MNTESPLSVYVDPAIILSMYFFSHFFPGGRIQPLSADIIHMARRPAFNVKCVSKGPANIVKIQAFFLFILIF